MLIFYYIPLSHVPLMQNWQNVICQYKCLKVNKFLKGVLDIVISLPEMYFSDKCLKNFLVH